VCVWERECGENGWPPDVIISKSSLGNSAESFPHYTNVGRRLIHPALLISLIFFPFFCCFCPTAGVRIRPSNFANVVNCVNQTTKLCRRVLYIYIYISYTCTTAARFILNSVLRKTSYAMIYEYRGFRSYRIQRFIVKCFYLYFFFQFKQTKHFG
jgi:hypothetical protein